MTTNTDADVRGALAELVALRDLHERSYALTAEEHKAMDDRVPRAWANARAALAAQPAAPSDLPAEFVNGSRLQAWITGGAEIHPLTANLVVRFCRALASKLAAAEKKYGYTDGWRRADWMDECRQHLMEHIAKGDPRDVAAYCAFLWHHGESTTAPSQPAAEPPSERESRAMFVARLEHMQREGSNIIPIHAVLALLSDCDMLANRAAPAPSAVGPVAWADEVEQRLYSWRHRMMNRDGDRVSLSDYMPDEDIDDLIDYVCSPLSTAPHPQPAPSEALTDSLRGLDTSTRVRFYEHDFYVLSNFSAFTLEWKDRRFDTSEAAYHWEKFIGNPALMTAIQYAPSAHEAFKIAERNKAERRPDWDDVKVGIMLDILRAKAAQHEYVRRKLLATGDRELVEDSWRDDFWGWGPNRDGKNMLGRLWMQVRAELLAAGRGE